MPKILHDVFSKPENWGNQEKGVLDYLKSPNFTEDQYVNLLSGKYEGASSYEIFRLESLKFRRLLATLEWNTKDHGQTQVQP